MGFFDTTALKKQTAITRIANGTECEQCGLYRASKFSKFPVIGEGRRRVLIILENATMQETYQQKQGSIGGVRNLERVLKNFGVSLLEDCWVVRAVRCVPLYEKGLPAPTVTQIENCRIKLQQTIKTLQPFAIVALGGIALKSLLGEYVPTITSNLFRGLFIPDQRYKAWVCSTYSLDYVQLYASD